MGDQPEIRLRAPPQCSRCKLFNLPGLGHNKSNRTCPARFQEAAQAAPAPPAQQTLPLPAVNIIQPNPQLDQLQPVVEQIIADMNQLNVDELPRRLLIDLSLDEMSLLIGKARTLPHVPKRVLPTARRAITNLFDRIKIAKEANDEVLLLDLLKKLQLFQFVVCSAPTEPCPKGVSWSKHTSSILLPRAESVLNDDWSNLYLDNFQDRIIPVQHGAGQVRVRNGARTRSMTAAERKGKQVLALARAGMLSKAYDRTVKDVKSAPATDATAEKLRNLYPPRQREIEITEADFSGIKDFREGERAAGYGEHAMGSAANKHKFHRWDS